MINTNRCQGHSGLYRVCSVQSEVRQGLLKEINITNEPNKERHALEMGIERRNSISGVERRVLEGTSTQDV
jgi:hypothetical protein